MTLTLDEVRRVRFRMARRSGQGYEVSDVDTFVDKVEESFNKMTNDAELLQRQIESLQNSQPAPVFAPVDESEELSRLRAELAQAQKDLSGARSEAERMKAELSGVRGELEAARAQKSSGSAGDQRAEGLAAEVQRLSSENERLRGELDRARKEPQKAMGVVGGPAGEHLVVSTTDQASPAVVRLVQLATEQAEKVVTEADSEAKRKVADAERRAFEITTDARTKADRVESEARVSAERLVSEATDRAAQIDRETADRRKELFAALEAERDDLRIKVDHLRGFESTFRDNLTNHLQSQLESLRNARPEPREIPALAARSGHTPRLDALMGE